MFLHFWILLQHQTTHGPLARYVNLRVAHAPGLSGTFFPSPRVSDLDMHHGTCVMHVPWCMLGLLTSSFLWSRWRGKCSRHPQRMRNPQFYVSGKKPMTLTGSDMNVWSIWIWPYLVRWTHIKYKIDIFIWNLWQGGGGQCVTAWFYVDLEDSKPLTVCSHQARLWQKWYAEVWLKKLDQKDVIRVQVFPKKWPNRFGRYAPKPAGTVCSFRG